MNTRLVSRIKVESITALGGSFCEIPIVLFALFLDVLVLVLVTIICTRVPPDGTKKRVPSGSNAASPSQQPRKKSSCKTYRKHCPK